MPSFASPTCQSIVDANPRLFRDCFDFWVGPGWAKFLADKIPLLAALDPDLSILQIKEKFGQLRINMIESTDEVWQLAESIEEQCSKLCETCGQPGTLRNLPSGRWIKTLCDDCEAKRIEENKRA